VCTALRCRCGPREQKKQLARALYFVAFGWRSIPAIAIVSVVSREHDKNIMIPQATSAAIMIAITAIAAITTKITITDVTSILITIITVETASGHVGPFLLPLAVR
jgi:hypothetical protein